MKTKEELTQMAQNFIETTRVRGEQVLARMQARRRNEP
jgi:hypothetical protein